MYDVFISYRRGKGSDLSSYIHSELSKRGFNCFFDVNEKYSGDFMKVVEQSIRKSDLFLILITEGSLERFVNPKDISRIEVEYALKHGVDILPISVIGDEMFRILDELPNLPKSAKSLKDFNCRLYKHELKHDTMNYLIELLENNREKRFKSIADKAFSVIGRVTDKDLNEYVETVENKMIEYMNKNYKYTGRLKFGKFDGQGTLTDLSSGLIYKLDWNPYGDYQGVGEVYKGSKLIYRGDILELKYDGKGTLFDSTFTYEGNFREGKIRGQGVMTQRNGTILTGDWLAGSLYSKGHIRYPDGVEYWGKTNDNIPNGYGTLVKEDGKKFDGFFRRGNIEQGAMYMEGGVFLGTFENEEPYGRGIMYDTNFNKVFEGTFKNGHLNGYGKFYMKGKNITSILPAEIYSKLKETYRNLDTKNIAVNGKFDGLKLLEYDDFSIVDTDTLSTICEGHIRSNKLNDFRFKVIVDYEEVYSNTPLI